MKFIAGLLLITVAQATATSLRENLLSSLGNEPCSGSSIQGQTSCGSNNYCLCGQPPNNVNPYCTPGLCYPGNLRDETPLCVYNVQCQSGVCQNLGGGNSQCGPTTQAPRIPCGNEFCTTGQLCLNAQVGQPTSICVASCAATGFCAQGGTCYQGQYCLASNLPLGSQCLASSQCVGSNVCTNNVCTAPVQQCAQTQCTSDQVCNINQGVGSCYTSCANTGICTLDKFCYQGMCLPLNLPVGSQCLASQQCVGNSQCQNGVCAQPPQQCVQTQCMAGQVCYISQGVGTCYESCANTGICTLDKFCYQGMCLPANLPVGSQCLASQQCVGSSQCQNGVCSMPVQQCAQTQCTSGQICNINQGVGTCYASCANTGVCTTNSFCFQGMCLPIGQASGQPCLTNSQCTSSQCGQTGVCLASCGNSFCQANQICMVAPGSGGQSTCFTACSASMPCPGSNTNVCVQPNNPISGIGGCLPGNLPSGSACQSSQQCIYGSCQSNVCQNW